MEILKDHRELRQDLILSCLKIGTATLVFLAIAVVAMLLLEPGHDHSGLESIGNWPVYQDELRAV
jgi:hypothetical protein